MTTRVPALDMRNQFSDWTNRVQYGGERIIVTRRSKPNVAVVPLDDLELLLLLEDVIDLEEARLALAEAEEKGTVSWEEVKKEIGL